METGYIKFECQWEAGPLQANLKEIEVLNTWRNRLFKLGLIGAYSNGIGFGNISIRVGKTNKFIITGSATGNFQVLNQNHYTVVTDYDIFKNKLNCFGPIKASSESLTHAVIYQSNSDIRGVIHVHNFHFWQKLLGKIPTTSPTVEYGTPEMAFEVIRLFKETNVEQVKAFAMGGHQEGVMSFGEDLNVAGDIILDLYQKNKTDEVG